jgi:hemoglobin
MNDILNLDDVKLVVDCFYGKVRQDEQLKDVFNNVIQDRWPAHLEKMYRFWQTVLLDEHTYHGSPVCTPTQNYQLALSISTNG